MSTQTATATEPTAAIVPVAPTERWGPPFNQQPFPWTRYKSPTDPGSWTSVGITWNGDIVAQLGAQPRTPNPPFTVADLLAYYVRDFKIGAAGIHDWVATVRTGPISRVTRGGHADVYAFLQVFGPGFNSVDLRPVASNQTISLFAGSSQFGGVKLQAGQYQIRVGSFCYIDYPGSGLPYAEFIGSVTAVTHYGAATYPALAAAAGSADLAGSAAAKRFHESLAADRGLPFDEANEDARELEPLSLESR